VLASGGVLLSTEHGTSIMNHIVIFRTHRFGDILQTHPMIQGLRETYPQAHITFILDEIYAELMQKSGLADTVIPIPYSRMFSGIPDRSLSGAQVKIMCEQYMTKLIRRPVDLAINRSFSNFSALFVNLLAPKRIIGKQFQENKGFCYDVLTAELMQKVIHQRTVLPMHLADIGCRLADVGPKAPRFQFFPDKDDAAWWSQLAETNGIDSSDMIIGVQMGANKQFRHWGTINYAAFIRQITDSAPTSEYLKFICFGSTSEASLFDELKAHLSTKHAIVNLTGKTTFGQLAMALSRCRLLLTGDTGTMHLATAVRLPVLALFYASAYYWETGPYGEGHTVIAPNIACYPCFEPDTCSFNLACREYIDPANVASVARTLLKWESMPSISGRLQLFQSVMTASPSRVLYRSYEAEKIKNPVPEKY
jgi:ADP-heptose:LPS heptosyltransferase